MTIYDVKRNVLSNESLSLLNNKLNELNKLITRTLQKGWMT